MLITFNQNTSSRDYLCRNNFNINKMKKYILYSALFIMFFCNKISAQYSIDNMKLFESALYLEFKDDNNKAYNGTGFIIRDKMEEGSFLYLVTAKHVLGKFNNSGNFIFKDDILNIYYHGDIYSEKFNGVSINLQNLWKSGNLAINNNSDVAICLIALAKDNKIIYVNNAHAKTIVQEKEVSLTTIQSDLLTKAKEVKIGNDVFVIGYPTSVGFENIPQIDYKKPLVKKGIVSGLNSKMNTIILDCELHNGNSGGPIFSYYPKTRKIKLIGVVIQYVPLAINSVIVNSGYSVGTPIEKIEEIIEIYRKKIITQKTKKI